MLSRESVVWFRWRWCQTRSASPLTLLQDEHAQILHPCTLLTPQGGPNCTHSLRPSALRPSAYYLLYTEHYDGRLSCCCDLVDAPTVSSIAPQ